MLAELKITFRLAAQKLDCIESTQLPQQPLERSIYQVLQVLDFVVLTSCEGRPGKNPNILLFQSYFIFHASYLLFLFRVRLSSIKESLRSKYNISKAKCSHKRKDLDSMSVNLRQRWAASTPRQGAISRRLSMGHTFLALITAEGHRIRKREHNALRGSSGFQGVRIEEITSYFTDRMQGTASADMQVKRFYFRPADSINAWNATWQTINMHYILTDCGIFLFSSNCLTSRCRISGHIFIGSSRIRSLKKLSWIRPPIDPGRCHQPLSSNGGRRGIDEALINDILLDHHAHAAVASTFWAGVDCQSRREFQGRIRLTSCME